MSIKGTVVRVSNIKPFCTKMAFECNLCGDIQVRVMCIGVETGERQGHCPSQPIFKVEGYEYAPSLFQLVMHSAAMLTQPTGLIVLSTRVPCIQTIAVCFIHLIIRLSIYYLSEFRQKDNFLMSKWKSWWYTEICTDSKRRNWALSPFSISLLGHHIIYKTKLLMKSPNLIRSAPHFLIALLCHCYLFSVR